MNKRLLAYIIGILMFSGTVLSAQVYKPIVKNPKPITSLCWNEDGSMFAYCEDSTILIRDAKTYRIINSIPQKNTQSIRFCGGLQSDRLMALTKKGEFTIWNCRNLEKNEKGELIPELSATFQYNNTVNSTAISKNGQYVAAALGDNCIYSYTVSQTDAKISVNVLKDHKAKVYYADFSEDSRYLISASEDGTVNVWNLADNIIKISLQGVYSQTHVPLRVTNDERIIFCKNANSIVVYEFSGKVLGTINVGAEVQDIQLLQKNNRIAVLTQKQDIILYSLSDFKQVGYIPTVISSPVTAYEFDSDCSRILVAFGDGSLYRFHLEDVLLTPEQKIPAFKTEIIEVPKKDDKKKSAKDSSDDEPKKELMPDSVYFNAGGGIITSTSLFTGDVYLGAEYRIAQMFPPFYFGGGYDFSLGFASSDYPYVYRFDGVVADSPKVFMNTLFASGGFVYDPWGIDIYVVLHTKFGIRLISVAISASGPYSISTTNCSVYLDAGFGAIYKMFECDLSCEYDVVNGFCPKLSLGWNLKIPAWWKKK